MFYVGCTANFAKEYVSHVLFNKKRCDTISLVPDIFSEPRLLCWNFCFLCKKQCITNYSEIR